MKPLAFVDIESTGVDETCHEMIEFGIWTERDGAWETRIKPEHIETASAQALKINGYTPELWKDAPTMAEVLPEICRRLEGHYMCGWNVGFDYNFVAAAVKQHGLKPIDYHRIDAAVLAVEHLPDLYSMSLAHVCHILGISNDGQHRALVDALRAKEVWDKLIRATAEQRLDWSDACKAYSLKKNPSGKVY